MQSESSVAVIVKTTSRREVLTAIEKIKRWASTTLHAIADGAAVRGDGEIHLNLSIIADSVVTETAPEPEPEPDFGIEAEDDDEDEAGGFLQGVREMLEASRPVEPAEPPPATEAESPSMAVTHIAHSFVMEWASIVEQPEGEPRDGRDRTRERIDVIQHLFSRMKEAGVTVPMGERPIDFFTRIIRQGWPNDPLTLMHFDKHHPSPSTASPLDPPEVRAKLGPATPESMAATVVMFCGLNGINFQRTT